LMKEPNAQVGVAGSMHSHYKQAIALRHAYQALAEGEMVEVEATKQTLSFKRKFNDQVLFCCFNLSDTAVQITMPRGEWHLVEQQLYGLVPPIGIGAHLTAWQYIIAVQA
nr:alpha-glucosidase C-terminal domain-containing protein [Oceanospirillaceae bacterium]